MAKTDYDPKKFDMDEYGNLYPKLPVKEIKKFQEKVGRPIRPNRDNVYAK